MVNERMCVRQQRQPGRKAFFFGLFLLHSSSTVFVPFDVYDTGKSNMSSEPESLTKSLRWKRSSYYKTFPFSNNEESISKSVHFPSILQGQYMSSRTNHSLVEWMECDLDVRKSASTKSHIFSEESQPKHKNYFSFCFDMFFSPLPLSEMRSDSTTFWHVAWPPSHQVWGWICISQCISRVLGLLACLLRMINVSRQAGFFSLQKGLREETDWVKLWMRTKKSPF